MKIKTQFFLAITSLLLATSLNAQSIEIYQIYRSKAEQIYQQMTLDEKIGQLLLPAYQLLAGSVSPNGELCQQDLQNPATPESTLITDCGLDQIAQYHIGAVLTGGGPYYNAPTLTNWIALNHLAAKVHQQASSYDPLLLTGNDTIHGNQHVQGAVIFPHDIGLGATHDTNLIYKIGQLVGQDSVASGFNWAYMPTIAVAQDLRWGRTYESFSLDPVEVKSMADAYISGLQNIQGNKLTGALATAKHFLGDGATEYGLDEGDDAYQGDEETFWNVNGQPYEGAINADVGSLMVSYSAINGDNTRMHFGGMWDIINQFKLPGITGTDGQNYQFNGFAVSDWNGPMRSAYFYDLLNKTTLTLPQIIAKTINGGVDMIMLGPAATSNPFDPNSKLVFANVGQVFDATKEAYQQGLIPDDRLEDAVVRILAVKLAMAPQSASNYAELQAQERKVALSAAEESLVLLKNSNGILPLKRPAIKNVIFIGDVNDIGIQNGGWTINWQGQKGNQYFTGADKISSGATTLAEGIQKTLAGLPVHYIYLTQNDAAVPTDLNSKNTVAIALLAEAPYAEFMGDIGNPYKPDNWYTMGAENNYNAYYGLPQLQTLSLTFNTFEASLIQTLREQNIPIITIVYSGRPVILTEGDTAAPYTNSDAVIAAFLPGTLGGDALAKAIFGDYIFRSGASGQSNTLTFPWPRDMYDVNKHFQEGALFPTGFGLHD